MSRTREKPKMTEDGFIVVYNKDDIPEFENEAEEAAFWDTHTWSEAIMREAAKEPRDPDLPAPREPVRSSHISLRLEDDALSRLKNLARKKGKGYQALLKEFVLERLYEEEKREGIIR